MKTATQQPPDSKTEATHESAAPAQAASRSDQDHARHWILGKSFGLLALRAVSIGFSLATFALLARVIGTAGFGAYQGVIAWLAILSVPAGLGAEKLVVQRIAIHRDSGQWSELHGLLRYALLGVAVAASLSAAGAFLLVETFALDAPNGLFMGLLVLPAMALLRITQAALQGLERIIWSQLPELLLVPVGFATALGIAWSLDISFSPATALTCLLGANVTALVVSMILLSIAIPSEVRSAKPVYAVSRWWFTALPLLIMAGLQVLNARSDILLLLWITDTDEVALYAVAQRCSGLLITIPLATNVALAPVIARTHHRAENKEMQAAVTQVARLTALIATPVVIMLLVFGDLIISIFGPEFHDARTLLTITSITQYVHLLMGPVALVLVMTGHVRTVACGLTVGVIVNIALDLILIPLYGGTGAAVASLVSVLVWNLTLANLCVRRISLHPTVLGKWK